MKLVSFNINSVRARIELLKNFLQKNNPDIVGLQEIKVQTVDFPKSEFADINYDLVIHGQKSYHGVAVFSKIKPVKYQAGIDFEGDQARFIYTKYNTDQGAFHLINCYFPQGENKAHPAKFPYKVKFYKGLLQWLEANFDSKKDNVAIMGDFNIAPQDCDIGIGEDNKKRWLRTGKCCFLPEEIELYQSLVDWGLSDPYRQLNAESNKFFSWFDYRSRGFEDTPKRGLRIDYVLCTAGLQKKCTSASIDYESRGQIKPSDHAPVIYEFDLTIK
ncbi:MAG: exodeoxyribonuclease III [SAR324 cluster bacterium]|nr:exodeoxyribonuclease III [SAR324 cluster bacterium]